MTLSCCKKFGSITEITSNDDGDFYFLNCFHLYRTEKKL